MRENNPSYTMNDENLKRGGSGGRPKGKPNRTTTAMRDMIIDIVNSQLDNVYDALEEIREKDKVQYLKLTQKFAEMVLPKQQEVELTNTPTIDVKATLERLQEVISQQ